MALKLWVLITVPSKPRDAAAFLNSSASCRFKLLVLAYLGGKRTVRMTFRAQGVFSEVLTFGLIGHRTERYRRFAVSLRDLFLNSTTQGQNAYSAALFVFDYYN